MGLLRSSASLRSRARASVTPPPKAPRKRHTANTSLSSASGTIFPIGIDSPGLEHNPALQGSNWYGSPDSPGIAIEMTRDTHMRAAYALGTNPIRTGKWAVIPGGEDSESKKCAAALEWNLFKELNWDAFLEKFLLCHRDGFSFHEITSDYVEFPSEFAPAGGVGLKYTGFEHIPAWTISEFVPKERNNRQLEKIKQFTGINQGMLIEKLHSMEWIFRYTLNQEGSVFGGFPTNRSCYGPWFLKMGYQNYQFY